MVTTKKAAAVAKKTAIVSTVSAVPNTWTDTRLTCIYKGVEMTEKSFDIKMILERRAKKALLECREACKSTASKAIDNSDFVRMFVGGEIKDSCYKNSLTVRVIDKKTSIMYQTGLHFIIAVLIDGKLFVNYFAFGNRTVTERERFKDYKHIKFIDGTVKAGTLEKLLFNCKDKEEAIKTADKFSYPSPMIDKGIKVYLAKCIAENNK